MIEKGCGRRSVRLVRAADLDRFAFVAAQLRHGIEMMDCRDFSIGKIDAHGAAGIGGIEIDDFAPDGDFARLVDPVIQKIA